MSKQEAAMNKNRLAKTENVTGIRKMLEGQGFVVALEMQGLTVAEVTGLRGKVRAAEAGLKVTKNTLTRLAVKDTPFENLTPFIKGPTALAWAQDPVGISRVLAEFARGNGNLKLKGSNLNGALLDAAATAKLATLPSLDELRARIVGMLVTPATRLAVILQAPGAQIARVLSARAEKEG